MKEILFLAHRIPYPPDKGDKIRSWHFLSGLARRFRVHVGTFIDDPRDWSHVEVLRSVCGEICVRPLTPGRARLRSLAGLLAGRPLTIDYYRDAGLAQWVRRLAAERPLAGVFVYSSSMAQYAEDLPRVPASMRVLDLCDVDSDKWRQYSGRHSWPMNWVFGREARRLEDMERRYCSTFDATLVIAEAEAAMLRGIAPGAADRISVLPNGVDTDYYDPRPERPSPFPADASPVVFTGAMDYLPNIDGVTWFSDEILPAVRALLPGTQFWIVGSNPAPEVTALGQRAGIVVTGRVADVRPYLAHAAVVVAPLRIARGVQNKVLEGLAMGRPIVATPNAVQGIPALGGRELAVAGSAVEFVDRVVAAIRTGSVASVGAARAFVESHHAWPTQVDRLASLLSGERPRAGTAAASGSGCVAAAGIRG